VNPKRPKVEPIRNLTIFEMEKLDKGADLASQLKIERPFSLPGILLGTSAFTANGWQGSFYPAGIQPRDFLSYYATQFDTVELDNAFYRAPALSIVGGWNARMPPGFLFTAKVPHVSTHGNVLVGCDEDLNHFLKTMDVRGDNGRS
jgi:hypothetical protein